VKWSFEQLKNENYVVLLITIISHQLSLSSLYYNDSIYYFRFLKTLNLFCSNRVPSNNNFLSDHLRAWTNKKKISHATVYHNVTYMYFENFKFFSGFYRKRGHLDIIYIFCFYFYLKYLNMYNIQRITKNYNFKKKILYLNLKPDYFYKGQNYKYH